jgi:hypothetical protein
MSELRLIHQDEAIAIGAQGNVLYIVWLGAIEPAGVDRLSAASKDLARAHPAGIVHLNLIATGIGLTALDDEARRRIGALLEDPASGLVASAIAYTETGFLAATVRGVLAGLALLARGGPKLRFFGELHEAETWLRGELSGPGRSMPPGTITRGVASLRIALGAQGTRI